MFVAEIRNQQQRSAITKLYHTPGCINTLGQQVFQVALCDRFTITKAAACDFHDNTGS